jgi:L-seryl-tRNA(Ser) seleniumtransferase
VGGRGEAELSAHGGRREAELRALPAVHELAAQLEAPHALAVAAARRAIDEQRALLIAQAESETDLLERARRHLAELSSPSLREVINATGVIVHTNLGRAPLPAAAREAVARAASGYSNLEFELTSGVRGSRQAHIEPLLRELTGAGSALAVNNCAGAVLLAVAALAGPGRAIVVSRGQLVEIGGGFRIPEVIVQSGSRLIEVGTTNRTRVADYERALAGSTLPVGAILRVHQSNFRTIGFVQEPTIEELCSLGPPVIDDLGSGVLSNRQSLAVLEDEPDLERSLAAGAALVCCSGDKLLGGPQAGLLLGREEAVRAAREHPLARALRIDKLSLAALEATLALYRDPTQLRAALPVLAMLDAAADVLSARAARLRDGIGSQAELVWTSSKAGGGALPMTELEGPAVALEVALPPVELAARLRTADPPVIARVHEGRVVLDPRTLRDDQVEPVIAAVRDALANG